MNYLREEFSVEESLREAALSWYEFGEGVKVLIVTCVEVCSNVLKNREEIERLVVDAEDTISDTFVGKYKEYFDYVIAVKSLEKTENPIQVLTQWMKLLKANGKLILGVDNRLGLRYFCGERDAVTNRIFAGIENYKTCIENDIGEKSNKKLYAKHEWQEFLENAGVCNYKFYSIYPNLEHTQLIFSENYQINEDLSIRYTPRYNDSSTVFLNEECVLSGIAKSDLLHLLANSYIIECSKNGCFSDIEHVTISMSRGPEYACMTKIRRNSVDKQAIFNKGVSNIRNLCQNMQDLKAHGVNTIEGQWINDKYCTPYVVGVTGNQYMAEQLLNNKEAFIDLMDHYRDLILQSSESYEDEKYGTILKRGYIDLVPLNSFWIDNEFVFFDQEFCIENLPANVILYRTIIIIYEQDTRLKKILPMEFLWKRYNMEKHMDYWQRVEIEFLTQIRNQEKMAMYDNLTMRNNSIADYIKNSIDSADIYEEYRESCFSDLEDKKIFLFGAGKYADKFLSFYKDDYNVCRILDNDNTKWGSTMHGIQIASPESIVGEQAAYKIIICAKNFEPIFKQLKNMQVLHIGIYDANYVYPGRQNLGLKVEKQKKYRVGYISGVFDLFHIGHLNMFKRAKEQCDYLIAGVTSDEYVRIQKQREPYIPFIERLEMVRSCRYVDEAVAVPFQYGGTVEAFQKYHFDCQFCGSDYVNDPWWLEQREYLRSQGADLVFFSYTEQTSSTKIKALIEQKLL